MSNSNPLYITPPAHYGQKANNSPFMRSTDENKDRALACTSLSWYYGDDSSSSRNRSLMVPNISCLAFYDMQNASASAEDQHKPILSNNLFRVTYTDGYLYNKIHHHIFENNERERTGNPPVNAFGDHTAHNVDTATDLFELTPSLIYHNRVSSDRGVYFYRDVFVKTNTDPNSRYTYIYIDDKYNNIRDGDIAKKPVCKISCKIIKFLKNIANETNDRPIVCPIFISERMANNSPGHSVSIYYCKPKSRHGQHKILFINPTEQRYSTAEKIKRRDNSRFMNSEFEIETDHLDRCMTQLFQYIFSTHVFDKEPKPEIEVTYYGRGEDDLYIQRILECDVKDGFYKLLNMYHGFCAACTILISEILLHHWFIQSDAYRNSLTGGDMVDFLSDTLRQWMDRFNVSLMKEVDDRGDSNKYYNNIVHYKRSNYNGYNKQHLEDILVNTGLIPGSETSSSSSANPSTNPSSDSILINEIYKQVCDTSGERDCITPNNIRKALMRLFAITYFHNIKRSEKAKEIYRYRAWNPFDSTSWKPMIPTGEESDDIDIIKLKLNIDQQETTIGLPSYFTIPKPVGDRYHEIERGPRKKKRKTTVRDEDDGDDLPTPPSISGYENINARLPSITQSPPLPPVSQYGQSYSTPAPQSDNMFSFIHYDPRRDNSRTHKYLFSYI